MSQTEDDYTPDVEVFARMACVASANSIARVINHSGGDPDPLFMYTRLTRGDVEIICLIHIGGKESSEKVAQAVAEITDQDGVLIERRRRADA